MDDLMNDDIGFLAALEYAERSYDNDAEAYGWDKE